MTRDNLSIRPMTRAELDTAIEWAAAEGWNPGLHDADAYYAADPDGYFVALQGGELVASISAVKYSPEYAFMGFFIVRPQYRGGTWVLDWPSMASDTWGAPSPALTAYWSRQTTTEASGASKARTTTCAMRVSRTGRLLP